VADGERLADDGDVDEARSQDAARVVEAELVAVEEHVLTAFVALHNAGKTSVTQREQPVRQLLAHGCEAGPLAR
jgi:hypothetical protein